jgi:hypothetical protein
MYDRNIKILTLSRKIKIFADQVILSTENVKFQIK